MIEGTVIGSQNHPSALGAINKIRPVGVGEPPIDHMTWGRETDFLAEL